MIPIILGAVALGAVSYGINKCMNDENCMDDIKDKISDSAMRAYEGIEKLEEKMGLNEYSFSKDEIDESVFLSTLFRNNSNETNIDTDNQSIFTSLSQFKIIINADLQYKHQLIVCKIKEIKKDKVQDDIEVTEQMIANAKEYHHHIKTFYTKIDEELKLNSNADIKQYTDILRELFITKIIKNGELNEKSTELIAKALFKQDDTNKIDVSSVGKLQNLLLKAQI